MSYEYTISPVPGDIVPATERHGMPGYHFRSQCPEVPPGGYRQGHERDQKCLCIYCHRPLIFQRTDRVFCDLIEHVIHEVPW